MQGNAYNAVIAAWHRNHEHLRRDRAMPLYVHQIPPIRWSTTNSCHAARARTRCWWWRKASQLHRAAFASMLHKAEARTEGRRQDVRGRRIYRPGDDGWPRRFPACPGASDAASRNSERPRPAPATTFVLAAVVPGDTPGFCIGCPERPIFAATKLVEQGLGCNTTSPPDIGLSPVLDHAALRARGIQPWATGWGQPRLRLQRAETAKNRSISFVGDGGFWHNGLTSSIGNAVFSKNDGSVIIVTGGIRRRPAGRTYCRRARQQRRVDQASIAGR